MSCPSAPTNVSLDLNTGTISYTLPSIVGYNLEYISFEFMQNGISYGTTVAGPSSSSLSLGGVIENINFNQPYSIVVVYSQPGENSNDWCIENVTLTTSTTTTTSTSTSPPTTTTTASPMSLLSSTLAINSVAALVELGFTQSVAQGLVSNIITNNTNILNVQQIVSLAIPLSLELEIPSASNSPFAPQNLSFPNNDKLTNSDESIIDDFLVFNPYIHYYTKSEPQTNLAGDKIDISYKIDYTSDYNIATPWDEYSKQFRDQIK